MPMTAEQLAERLAKNAPASAAEMRAELEQNEKSEEKPVDPNDDPRARVEYEFDFHYTDARGKVWEGKFVHRIPTLAQRDTIDLIQASKKRNMPVESFSGMAAERHLFVAHLEVCLAKRPDWAKDLEALYDPAIVENLYAEVASHEAYFLGWGQDQGGGKDKRGEGDSQPS